MAIGSEQAAIRIVIASALADQIGETGRSIDALIEAGGSDREGPRGGRVRNQASELSWRMARFSSKDDPIEPMMLENVRQSGGAV